MCHVCTRVPAGEPAVVLGKEKAFTFDRVFDISSSQDIIYNNVVKDLVDGCLQVSESIGPLVDARSNFEQHIIWQQL